MSLFTKLFKKELQSLRYALAYLEILLTQYSSHYYA